MGGIFREFIPKFNQFSITMFFLKGWGASEQGRAMGEGGYGQGRH